MHTKQKAISFFAMVLVLMFTVAAAMAAPDKLQPEPTEEINTKWATYTDPRFDFTVEYPSDWYLIPRDDSNPEAVSGILTFALFDPADTELFEEQIYYQVANPNIVIGLYSAELSPNQSLSEWTNIYEKATNALDEDSIQRESRRVLEINGADAVHENGVSPMTEYQFTNFTHDKTVWFIWTNIGNSADAAHLAVYERMVNSFQFGNNTPATLSDVYGNSFKPIDLDSLSQSMASLSNYQAKTYAQFPKPFSLMTSLGSGWFSPVESGSSGQYYVRCGSTAHTGSAEYAADVNAPYQRPVYAARGGTKILAT